MQILHGFKCGANLRRIDILRHDMCWNSKGTGTQDCLIPASFLMPRGQIVGRAKRVKIKLRLKLSSAGVSHHHDRGT